ncbi:ABC transporter permease, partial [Listeria monocytogenes]|nr:ABC transporter permease [Listeria monocytogenes]NVS33072.1 ABC transporter permease [Listeria monocytogenes]
MRLDFSKKTMQDFERDAEVVHATRERSFWRFMLADRRAVFATSVLILITVACI